MASNSIASIWSPQKFTLGYDNLANEDYATIVLNQPIENQNLFFKLCEHSKLLAAADGGANSIYDLSHGNNYEEKVFSRLAWSINDKHFSPISRIAEASIAVVGDFDSVRSNVLEFYRQKGVEIIHDDDKYSTDMQKTIDWTQKAPGRPQGSDTELLGLASPPVDTIVFGGLGGRADQMFSQFHQLYIAAADREAGNAQSKLYLITTESIVFILEKGLNRITTPVAPGFFTENVGIIPIGRPAVITTHGFEWDVQNWHTEFGTQMSTSNHVKASEVEVQTDEKVLFTMEFAQPPNS